MLLWLLFGKLIKISACLRLQNGDNEMKKQVKKECKMNSVMILTKIIYIL